MQLLKLPSPSSSFSFSAVAAVFLFFCLVGCGLANLRSLLSSSVQPTLSATARETTKDTRKLKNKEKSRKVHLNFLRQQQKTSTHRPNVRRNVSTDIKPDFSF